MTEATETLFSRRSTCQEKAANVSQLLWLIARVTLIRIMSHKQRLFPGLHINTYCTVYINTPHS